MKEIISLDELHRMTRDLALVIEDKSAELGEKHPQLYWEYGPDQGYRPFFHAMNVDIFFKSLKPYDITITVNNIAQYTSSYIGKQQAIDYINAAIKCSFLSNERFRHHWFHKDESCGKFLNDCKKTLESMLQKEKDTEEAKNRVYGNCAKR